MAESTQQRKRPDPILEQIKAQESADVARPVRCRTRRTKIRPEYVGHTIAVFNGREYTKVRIKPDMVGKSLAKVAPQERPTARARFVHVGHRKMRQVAALVADKPVEEALGILNYLPKKAAIILAKTLKSAVANKLSLEGTSHLSPEDLRVRQVTVDEAPTAKRIRFRSMGRIYRLRKHYSHIGVFLETRAGAPTAAEASGKARPKAAAKETVVETPTEAGETPKVEKKVKAPGKKVRGAARVRGAAARTKALAGGPKKGGTKGSAGKRTAGKKGAE